MFRTRSLTGQQMKAVIDKNRPSQILKQNRVHSLRTLLADKTRKYHQHMQKLSDQVSKSGRKVKRNSPSLRIVRDMSNSEQSMVQQFCPEWPLQNQASHTFESIASQNQLALYQQPSIISTQYLPTQPNPSQIDQQPQPNPDSPQQSQSPPPSQHSPSQHSPQKSAFRVTLQNQQLADQNRELRRQIQSLQQRLETAELMRIQKESEAQSYRLTGKIVELRLGEAQARIRDRDDRWTRFGVVSGKEIKVEAVGKVQMGVGTGGISWGCLQVQTQQTAETIGRYIQQIAQKEQLVIQITHKIQQITRTMQQKIGIRMQNSSLDNIQGSMQQISIAVSNKFNEIQQIIQLQQIKYQQMQAKYVNKIHNLVQMLNLAQNQIKVLLSKLKQAKDQKIVNYRQMLSHSYRNSINHEKYFEKDMAEKPN